ncbi:hypothetical protein [Nonomuraea sp. SBT364]|uniref:hypothetical protein n=1 Tax=Nonomuraea sp. SBT364 TaxID=1580530 RepID=UPI0012E3160C|nr:hypothetical protein [Nonomuraea sp. SBT364]
MRDVEAVLQAEEVRPADMREIGVRLRGIEADLAATWMCVTQVRAEVAAVRGEVDQEFAALGVELTGARLQVGEHFRTARSEMREKYDLLRCEMIELGIRLDRLLDQDG